MPEANDLKDRLTRYRQVMVTVTGRKSGRASNRPVWFVWEDPKLYLLPVHGSETEWYKNVQKNPRIRVEARGPKAEFRAMPLKGKKQVSSVIEKFREKYGAADVKRYYTGFDVAVVAKA
jgi:deazaflavin-dependent oxidoreductase (nitroreductase family)